MTWQARRRCCAPLDGREHAALGRLRFARAVALDGNAAQAASPAATACGRNADARALQDTEKPVAAGGLDPCGVVDGDGQRRLGDQPSPRREQPEGHANDQHDDDEVAEHDFGHGAAICAKEEKPSDMSPASMKVMPRPRSPAGRSAYARRVRIAESITTATAKPKPAPRPKTAEFSEAVAALDHEEAPREDGALHRQKREEHAEGRVHAREEPVEQHLQQLHHSQR